MRSFLGEVNESADLPLYDDLHRALLDEQEVGFVFELMKEKAACKKGKHDEFIAGVMRSSPEEPNSWLRKRSLADVSCCG